MLGKQPSHGEPLQCLHGPGAGAGFDQDLLGRCSTEITPRAHSGPALTLPSERRSHTNGGQRPVALGLGPGNSVRRGEEGVSQGR